MKSLALAALLAVALGCCTFALQRPHPEPSPPLPQATAPIPPAPLPAAPATPMAPASATTEKALDLAKWHLNYAHGVLREHALEDDSHHD